MPTPPLRLITMPLSHFCEKVRWTLDRQGLSYREEGHAPMFHALATLRHTGLGSRTVPILIDDSAGQRHVLDDSTAILRHLERQHGVSWLFAAPESAELEDELDVQFGPHSRRLFYFHMLPHTDRLAEVFAASVPRAEAAIATFAFPLIARLMRRSMNVSPAGYERSLAKVEAAIARTSERLRDGRRYLCGDAFGAADLTFAALSGPILLPPGYSNHRIPMPELTEIPPALRDLVERFRATPAGQFALRLFAEERRPA